jgi:hypothetical protein
VAHEPPAVQALPGRERALAANTDIRQTYQRRGFGPAMAKFLTLVSLPGPVPDDYADRPAPDPAAFGLPAQDDGSRDDALLGLNMISLSQYRHDFTALRAVPPESSSVRARNPARRWPGAGRWRWPDGSGLRRSPSPAATADSSRAEVLTAANRTPSPAPCARSFPADGPRGGLRAGRPRRSSRFPG